MFACFDQPDLKATFSFTVTVPTHWQVVSNSPTAEPAPGAAIHRPAGGLRPDAPAIHLRHCACRGPVPRGPQRDAGKRARPWACSAGRPSREHLDADELFDVTAVGFGFFEDVFGLAYPFAKYDQLCVPDFNAGAMENEAASRHPEDYVFRSRVTDAEYERGRRRSCTRWRTCGSATW